MKKSLQIFLAIFVFFLVSTYSQTASVITENANLRGTPSDRGKIVDTIAEGSAVEIIKQRGAWFLVQTSDYAGWMHGNTLKIISSLKPSLSEIPASEPVYSRPPVYTSPARRSSESRTYIRGPRGGCYYINSNGNKTYVNRSLCN